LPAVAVCAARTGQTAIRLPATRLRGRRGCWLSCALGSGLAGNHGDQENPASMKVKPAFAPMWERGEAGKTNYLHLFTISQDAQ
jgi:hypothetical protein